MAREDLEQIFREHYPKLLQFIYKMTFNWSLAEDIAQESIIKGIEKIDTFRHESSLQVWLNKIAYNLFLDNKKKNRFELIQLDLYSIVPESRIELNITHRIVQKTMFEFVKSEILSLPENYRTSLLLDMQGYSNQEIANIMDCTLQNVKILLHRGRKKLKEALGNDCRLYYDKRNVLCCVAKER